MKNEKEYIIKVGDLYLSYFIVNMYEVKTEFIEKISFGVKEFALSFPDYEEAKLMKDKIFIVLGIKSEVVENDTII
ncbi:MAG: hypothetical protein II309_04985 [Bacilli bacterium]|nr:hypothetical protein [Bacilli bacterium]